VTATDPPIIGAGAPSPTESFLTTGTPVIRRGESARFELFVGDGESNPVEGVLVAFVADKNGTFSPRETTTSAQGTASTTYRPDANGAHLIQARMGTVTLASATLSVTGSSGSNDGGE
jgi:hypothetical protein